MVLRDGFGSPVPRQPVHLHTQAESGADLVNYGIPPDFRDGVHLLISCAGHRLNDSCILRLVMYKREVGRKLFVRKRGDGVVVVVVVFSH